MDCGEKRWFLSQPSQHEATAIVAWEFRKLPGRVMYFSLCTGDAAGGGFSEVRTGAQSQTHSVTSADLNLKPATFSCALNTQVLLVT